MALARYDLCGGGIKVSFRNGYIIATIDQYGRAAMQVFGDGSPLAVSREEFDELGDELVNLSRKAGELEKGADFVV